MELTAGDWRRKEKEDRYRGQSFFSHCLRFVANSLKHSYGQLLQQNFSPSSYLAPVASLPTWSLPLSVCLPLLFRLTDPLLPVNHCLNIFKDSNPIFTIVFRQQAQDHFGKLCILYRIHSWTPCHNLCDNKARPRCSAGLTVFVVALCSAFLLAPSLLLFAWPFYFINRYPIKVKPEKYITPLGSKRR